MVFVLILTFVVLLFLGVPLGFCMILASLAYIVSTGAVPLEVIPQRMLLGLDVYTWLAIPLFLLAGELMNAGGVTTRLVRSVQGIIGHLRGGLAHVTVVTNLLMSGISGSALADAAGTGSVLIPSMERAGYTKRFASALVAASSTIGPIFPPSIPFILYATLANVSVGKMFVAGVLPGVLMAISLMGIVGFLAQKEGFPKEARLPFKEAARAVLDAFFALIMPVIILGGILSGVFTATEAAGVAVVYAFVISILVYRELKLSDIPSVLLSAAKSSAVIMFVISAAALLTWLLTYSRVAAVLGTAVTAISDNPIIVLLMINLLVLFLGCFIEATPLILILTPILLPVVTSVGIDPVHFGLVLILNLMVGLITPPVGMTLFITAGIAKTDIIDVARGVFPFIIAIGIVVLLATLFPSWVMWLPNRVG